MSLREHAKAKTTNSEAKGAIIAGCRKVGIVMGVAGGGEGRHPQNKASRAIFAQPFTYQHG